MVGKIRYIGKSFGVESLTNGTIYDVVEIDKPFFRIIDDSGEEYLYSIYQPGDLTNEGLYGEWQVVEDDKNESLKRAIENNRI